MMKIVVTYSLSDEQEKRLDAIVREYKNQGMSVSPESMFSVMMITGSVHDIDARLTFEERCAGLIKTFK